MGYVSLGYWPGGSSSKVETCGDCGERQFAVKGTLVCPCKPLGAKVVPADDGPRARRRRRPDPQLIQEGTKTLSQTPQVQAGSGIGSRPAGQILMEAMDAGIDVKLDAGHRDRYWAAR